MVSVNELAFSLIEEILDYEEDYEEEYRINVETLDNGATIIDCGVNVPGGYTAGILYTQVCMGGLADVDVYLDTVKNIPLTFIKEYTDHPALACLGCQKAGWQIKVGDYFAMGSGPARALALKPKKTYELLDYEDDAEYAIIALESDRLPDEKVVEYIAKECDVEPEDVYVLVAPTASIVGSVQISGRIIEMALYRMAELGYDVNRTLSATGRCPIAPVLGDNLKAMGATNDSLLYYGSVYLTVDGYSEELDAIASCESSDYGRPFYEIFKDADYDFYKIDPKLFAPAHVAITDMRTGKTRVHGKLNADVLLQSYDLS
ncbi:methenyltetrahydromethanopterin cyclohydrolase [Archaeoglobus veneficus]|uniref:Methenyltetrahydromethanopterin cyclohydrolase n=1 Tax=Archaeoglobus veneficus (strain DSM 11195 / SNP6) TaxID=693661 RepID=F2KS65_ARCVS|nr:methenyltetrahydromethanopterin cyclohydrolase [Archaeoglobus veneficus]AEA48004.1 Methenyltetrahydromethanopterin cyclohydrolase [Archaeoglobus veneficus SNP6]